MKVEVQRVNLVTNKESKRKGYASIVIEDSIAINDVAIIEGSKGLFISFPQKSYEKDGETKYSDIIVPITAPARKEITEAVLEAYDAKLAEQA